MRGLRVGVTGARKARQLAQALERRGALPVLGPLVMRDLPAGDDALVAVTDRVIAARPEWLAASTGVGLRLWAETARRHGRFEPLRTTLAGTRRVARGAKAVGGLAAFDLSPEHTTPEETDAAVVAWLVDRLQQGQTVVAQVHGADTGAYDALTDKGADVVPVRPYVAGRLPEEERQARDLVRAIATGDLDVVTFTSPAAARNLYEVAAQLGPELVTGVEEALGSSVAVAVIGPVTGEVFRRRGVPIAVEPARHRLGDLVRALERWAAGGP